MGAERAVRVADADGKLEHRLKTLPNVKPLRLGTHHHGDRPRSPAGFLRQTFILGFSRYRHPRKGGGRVRIGCLDDDISAKLLDARMYLIL